MSQTIIERVTLVTVSCAQCGIVFAVPDHFDQVKRQHGSTFYCPSRHPLVYKSENDELKRKVAQLQARNTHLADQRDAADRDRETARRSAAAYRGQVTRIRKRVGNGVCPCCNRTFANVARHMASRHPDYRDSEVTP